MDGNIGSLIFPVLMLAVFYFFFLRPQMKKQKEVKNLQDNLKKGSRVVTNSGIHGKIVDFVDGNGTVMLDLGKTTIQIDRNAITGLENKESKS